MRVGARVGDSSGPPANSRDTKSDGNDHGILWDQSREPVVSRVSIPRDPIKAPVGSRKLRWECAWAPAVPGMVARGIPCALMGAAMEYRRRAQ